MFAISIACAVSLIAANLIFISWRRGLAALAALGWLAAFGSAFLWSWALGPEIGVTYAFMVFICLAWVAVAAMAEGRPQQNQSLARPYRRLHWPKLREISQQFLLFLLSVPALGAITMLLSVAVVRHLPWSMPTRFLVAMVLYPILWGALGAWVCAQSSLRKPALVSGVLCLIAASILFV